MRLILGDFVLGVGEEFGILQNGGVVFDEKIIDVGSAIELKEKYKNAAIEQLPPNSVIMPALINSHVHLEFSANIATLKFGDFMSWLRSVINSRGDLSAQINDEIIQKALDEMLLCGTGTIGAISSFGLDLDACVKSPMNVVYFVEVLGSNPSAIDALFGDFKARFFEAKKEKNQSFYPAISVHSPYSTHAVLARHALDLARSEKVQVSAHFMEARCEREWLDNGGGEMAEFIKAFNPHAKPSCTAQEFLALFEDTNPLFVHCVQASAKELEQIERLGGAIAHCPRSNRLLGTGALELAQKNSIALGTDGLSSNISLNLWDEMRAALFTHQNYPLEKLALFLLKAATIGGAKALGLPKGVFKRGFDADIITLEMRELPSDISQLPLHLILQTKNARRIYLRGKEI